VAVLIRAAGRLSTPVRRRTDAGAALPLVGLFYLGCIPAVAAGAALPEERWTKAAGLQVVWMALWIVLVAVL
jgi:hypothetical protein